MAKRKIVQLPAECLSYSQVSMWLSSPKRYREIFFNQNEDARFMNAGMAYGEIVADALENEEETGDLLTDMAIGLLEKYDIKDQEMEGWLKTPNGWVKIISHPDTMDSKTFALREYKTGRVKWTQKKADNWFQLKFYAMLIYLVHGVIPPSCYLDWIETFADASDDGKVKPTGHVETFKVKIGLREILETMAITSRVAKEIETEWVVHEKPKEQTLEEWLENEKTL